MSKRIARLEAEVGYPVLAGQAFPDVWCENGKVTAPKLNRWLKMIFEIISDLEKRASVVDKIA